MNLYFDTSSLFKVYVEEEGSPGVRGQARLARTIWVSLIAYAEFRGSLSRARRGGRLTETAYGETLSAFQRGWQSYLIREVTEPLVSLAGELAAKHYLRGFDAIHLASAVTLQQELGEPVTFSASDDRLMSAAAAERLFPAS